MYERLKQIREAKSMSQAQFAKALGMGQSTLGMMEVGKREILDRHVKTICSIFNVNENWFRTGVGNMFNTTKTFSLDKYAEEHHLTSLELDIVREYMSLDESVRNIIMDKIKSVVQRHVDEEIFDLLNEESNDNNISDNPIGEKKRDAKTQRQIERVNNLLSSPQFEKYLEINKDFLPNTVEVYKRLRSGELNLFKSHEIVDAIIKDQTIFKEATESISPRPTLRIKLFFKLVKQFIKSDSK